MKTTYLAHTPYHVVLSAAMAEGDSYNNELILIQDTDNDTLAHILRESNIFSSVITLPGLYSTKNYIKRRAILIQNEIYLQYYLRRNPPTSLVVFNDRRQDTQAAIHASRSATIIYAEDGAAAYSSNTQQQYSGISLLARKFAYGYWYESVPVLGTTKWIDEVRATNPANIRQELKRKPITEIPRSDLSRVGEQEWVIDYITQSGVSQKGLENMDVIVVPAHSSFKKSTIKYKKVYECIFEKLADSERRVTVKYHPRDTHDPLGVAQYDSVEILPNQIPFEFYIAATNNATIIGDISTSLLTASFISNSDIFSIFPLLEYNDSQLYSTFNHLGVTLVHNWNGIEREIISR